MVWLPLHIRNFWILFKIRSSDLLQALFVLVQPSVSTLRQVSPPLHFRRFTLTAKFLTTTLQYPDLPVFQRVFNPSPREKTHNLRYNIEKTLDRFFKFHCISPILPISTSHSPHSLKDRPPSPLRVSISFSRNHLLLSQPYHLLYGWLEN